MAALSVKCLDRHYGDHHQRLQQGIERVTILHTPFTSYAPSQTHNRGHKRLCISPARTHPPTSPRHLVTVVSGSRDLAALHACVHGGDHALRVLEIRKKLGNLRLHFLCLVLLVFTLPV